LKPKVFAQSTAVSTGRQNALEYAQQCAGYGRCDIQVLDRNWNVIETIANEDLKPVV